MAISTYIFQMIVNRISVHFLSNNLFKLLMYPNQNSEEWFLSYSTLCSKVNGSMIVLFEKYADYNDLKVIIFYIFEKPFLNTIFLSIYILIT